MRTRQWLVATVIALAGCQSKLNDERTLNLDVGAIKEITIDAPKYDQKVTIALSSDADVTIVVYLVKDKNEVEGKLDKYQKPAAALAFKEDVLNATLEVTIPAKQEAIVRIQSNKKAAAVKLSMTGK